MSHVRGISGGDPSFMADDGSADSAVSSALAAYAAGEGSEHAALVALAASRLLVPIVAVLAGQSPAPEPSLAGRQPDMSEGGHAATPPGELGRAGSRKIVIEQADGEKAGGQEADGETAGGQQAGAEKASEMALPTLIGMDGRRAIPAFTCIAAMQRWRRDARPVPAAALQVWQAAAEDSCAVVIDVGGPVPFAVEGARLAALARGQEPPAPWDDPDVREVVAGVLAGRLEVAAFDLRPGDTDHDMVIALSLAPGEPAADVSELATQVAGAVLERLGGRLRRGVAIWLGVAG